MARRAPLAGIPLAFRLPNAPDLCVGRDDEAETVLAALKGRPTAVIRGPADIGKTTLALAVTHAARRRRPETVRWLGPDDTALGPRLLRALAPKGTIDADDWSHLGADPDALWTTVLDLGQRGLGLTLLQLRAQAL